MDSHADSFPTVSPYMLALLTSSPAMVSLEHVYVHAMLTLGPGDAAYVLKANLSKLEYMTEYLAQPVPRIIDVINDECPGFKSFFLEKCASTQDPNDLSWFVNQYVSAKVTPRISPRPACHSMAFKAPAVVYSLFDNDDDCAKMFECHQLKEPIGAGIRYLLKSDPYVVPLQSVRDEAFKNLVGIDVAAVLKWNLGKPEYMEQLLDEPQPEVMCVIEAYWPGFTQMFMDTEKDAEVLANATRHFMAVHETAELAAFQM